MFKNKFFYIVCIAIVIFLALPIQAKTKTASVPAPVPLLAVNKPVNWWFAFKFNAASFPACNGASRLCLFGGNAEKYTAYGQQFVYASDIHPALERGNDCIGDEKDDPIGATFDQIYNHNYFYVIWNDQFYNDPPIKGCTDNCAKPWGHSKGILAWDKSGNGLVMQVSTPSWPASGSIKFPRKSDGNTLGCVNDNNVKVSQHFFALRLTKEDLKKVLMALQNSSVVTDIKNPQIVNNGGPTEIITLVKKLGTKSKSTDYLDQKLSSGIELISKPSNLNVPAWQMVSAILDGVPLRTATWWSSPRIPSTNQSTPIQCWSASLAKPGSVDIATSGHWDNRKFGLTGGAGSDYNHAKIGVGSTAGHEYTIFGDLNQQGALTGDCSSSQNGRGGLFYVLDNHELFEGISNLIKGSTAASSKFNE